MDALGSLMMAIFFHAARIALVAFDPYLGSKPLADALVQSPPGQVIAADAYYAFSSVVYYAKRDVLLLNGRINNLQYGSYAPGAPQVFIDAHEMGGRQFFFPPNADPIHHEIADQPVNWINRIGAANAAGFGFAGDGNRQPADRARAVRARSPRLRTTCSRSSPTSARSSPARRRGS